MIIKKEREGKKTFSRSEDMNNLEDFKRRLLDKNELAKDVLNSREYKISRLIFKNRMELGLTQVELARKANVTQKTISRIEGADKGVRERTLIKVLQALEMDINSPALKEIIKADDEISASIKI